MFRCEDYENFPEHIFSEQRQKCPGLINKQKFQDFIFIMNAEFLKQEHDDSANFGNEEHGNWIR